MTPGNLFLPIRTAFPQAAFLSIPPTSANFSVPLLSILVTIKPTSSICAEIRSLDFALCLPFLKARIFPRESTFSSSAYGLISSRIISLISSSSPETPQAVHNLSKSSMFIKMHLRPQYTLQESLQHFLYPQVKQPQPVCAYIFQE